MTKPTLLEKTLNERYDVSVCSAPAVAIVWTAEYLLETGTPVEEVKKQLRTVNRIREKQGKIPAYVAYGSPLF